MNAPVAFKLSVDIKAAVEIKTDDFIELSVSSEPRGVIGADDCIEDIADGAAQSVRNMIIRVYRRAQEVAQVNAPVASGKCRNLCSSRN